MAYNQPVSSRIVLRSRAAQAATNNTLSTVSFSSVDIGSSFLSTGSPPTVFNAPYAGHYDVLMEGWCCGTGSGSITVTSKTGSTTNYAQNQVTGTGCFVQGCHFVIPNVSVGDTITIQISMNTTGTVITSITNTTTYQQGVCTIYYYPSN